MSGHAGRFGGWAVCGFIVLLTAQPLNALTAQHFSIGPEVAFGDYREVSSDLHYRGVGGGATATVTWRKFSADIAISKVTYKPTSDGTATQQFDAREVDVRLRYYVSGPISAELGFVNRKADPEFEAQSMGAITAGAHMGYLLGPGVHMALSGGLMFGPRFSGGGTISPLGALRLGLGLTVDALRGRLRFNGDYDFQRISRKTNDGSGELPAPIQQSLGRAGMAVAF
ncbi:MAG: hypothetical protein AUI08_04955 [Gemmatimonadetes bacterium 13_2_20CM_2_65_7]|nr:MAG: hypothetical protein AUI08_04955 [Gemmatimonadetes bacterium 13_2_20CM_2_65_7]